ncbi:hypothetical protein ACJX0J_008655, partial [Zea mays]
GKEIWDASANVFLWSQGEYQLVVSWLYQVAGLDHVLRDHRASDGFYTLLHIAPIQAESIIQLT